VACARAAGDQRELSFALSCLAQARDWQGHADAAYELCTQAVAAGRAAGDAAALAEALFQLGGQLVARAEYAAALAALQEALHLGRAIGYHQHVNDVHWRLAWLALAQGDLAVARERVRASIETARASGNSTMGLRPLQLAARLAIVQGQYGLGVRLFATVAGWQVEHHVVPDSTLWLRWGLPGDDAALASARASLGDEPFAATWAAGLHLGLDHALAEALASTDPTDPHRPLDRHPIAP
jgi:tetratricopeptide (TPR) repeat protein